jgi:sugar/nucleoside kinase (ribokinase family)
LSHSQRDAKRGELLVLGDLCLDVDVYPSGVGGKLRRASRISLTEGGSAGNVAFTAERLGIKTGLATPINCDDLGVMLQSLVKEKHKNLALYTLKSTRLSCAIINIVNRRGARRAYYQKNEGDRPIGDLYEAASRYKTLHMSGYSLELFDIDELIDFIHGLKLRGVLVSLDLFPRIGTTMEGKPRLDDLLREIDLLFGNLKEFKTLSGSETLGGVKSYIEKRSSTAVVKLGAKGALYKSPVEVITSKPRRVTPSNLRGAGDVFAATFLSSRLRGHGVEASLDNANELAGMHVSGDDSRISPAFLASGKM